MSSIQDTSMRHGRDRGPSRGGEIGASCGSGRENIEEVTLEKQRTKEIHIPLTQSDMSVSTLKSMPQPRAAAEVKELDDAAM